MANPLISICIPVFNGEKHLEECLASVFVQRFSDYEVIIVDDGSSDASLEVISRFKQKYSNLQLFRNEKNMGLVANWNRCIELSSGKWIKFLFQDDYLLPHCLETFITYANKYPMVHLFVSKRKFILEDGVDTEENRRYYNLTVKTIERLELERENDFILPVTISNTAVMHMTQNFISEPTSAFFRRNSLTSTGMFDSRLKQICDLEFVLRIGSHYGLVYIPKELTAFRIHSASTTLGQIRDKYYDLAWLEPVRMAHILLFDPRYETFRNQLTFFSVLKLRMYFYLRSYEAYKRASVEKDTRIQFDRNSVAFPESMKFKRFRVLLYFIHKLVLLKRKLS